MIDLKAVRDDPAGFDDACRRRGMQRQSARILELDASRRQVQTELQTLQARRNEASKEIGRLKREGGDEIGRAHV